MAWAIESKLSKFHHTIIYGVFVFFGAFLITYLFASLNSLAGETHAQESSNRPYLVLEGKSQDFRIITKIPRP